MKQEKLTHGQMVVNKWHIKNLEKAKEFHVKNKDITSSINYAINLISKKITVEREVE